MRGVLVLTLGGMGMVALGCGFLEDEISSLQAEGVEVTTEADEGAEDAADKPAVDAASSSAKTGEAAVKTSADGTTTITDGQGNTVTVGADGSTSATSASGASTSVGSDGAVKATDGNGNTVKRPGRPGLKPNQRPGGRGGD